jgi:hypothetical protein
LGANQTAALQESRSGISYCEAKRRLECLREELAQRGHCVSAGDWSLMTRTGAFGSGDSRTRRSSSWLTPSSVRSVEAVRAWREHLLASKVV